MMTRTLILALALTAAAAPIAAQAQDKVAVVRLDGLDLTRATDRDQLNTRLKTAARSVCGTGLRGTKENNRRKACVSVAFAQAKLHAQRAIAQAQGAAQLALLMIGGAR